MSSFWDDIQSTAKSLVSGEMSNVGQFLAQQVLGGPQLVKVGQNPGGNLSAAQINAGVKAPVQTVVSNNNAQKDADYNNKSFLEQYGLYLGIGAAALVVLIIVARR